MKNNVKAFLTLGALLASLTGLPSARADDAGYNLKITGTIVAQTCDVVDKSQNQTVNMGDFASTDFPASGSTSTEKDFSIELTGCTPGIAGTKLMFSGNADASNPALLALADTGGQGEMATGLGIEILDAAHQAISINNTDSSVYALHEGDNALTFYLRYKSTADTVTAGDATSVMYFDLQYQ